MKRPSRKTNPRCKRYYDAKAWKKVNEINKVYLYEFVEYLRAMNRSEDTIKTHEKELKILFTYMLVHNGNKDFVDMRLGDFGKLQKWGMNEWKWSPTRFKSLKYSISAFANFLLSAHKGIEPKFDDFENWILMLKNPKPAPVLKKYLITDNTLEKLVNYLNVTHKYEQLVMVMIACCSGLTRNEMLQLNMSDFDDDKIRFDCLYETHPIETRDKANRLRITNKYILTIVRPYIDKWREQREQLGIDIDAVFVATDLSTGEHSRRKSLHDWLVGYTAVIGDRINYNMFKYKFSDQLIGKNIPINIVKEYFQWDATDINKKFYEDDPIDYFLKYCSQQNDDAIVDFDMFD